MVSSRSNFAAKLCMASVATMAITNNMESAQGFAPVSITTIASNTGISAEAIIRRNSRILSSPSSLSMSSSSAQDEIARLRAAAAKAREEAAILSKVRIVWIFFLTTKIN
jgi:Zn-dependent peptidase ImmA (M78 family)